jgi:hypothetical protein
MGQDVLCLDSALALTRGKPSGWTAALAGFYPPRAAFTNVASSGNGGAALIGRVHMAPGSRSARLAFVAPGSAAGSPELPGLFEGLARQAGEWGAFHVLGEVEELNPAFEALRRAGFSIYAWQRIWRLELKLSAPPDDNFWQPVTPADEPAVRSLFQNLVPPLVQSAEPLPGRRLRGLAYRQNKEIMAYVEGVFGPRGLFLHPIVHPDISDAAELVRSLALAASPPGKAGAGRPIYLAVRSYQSWLEPALAALPAESSPRHGLLVKHLASLQRVPLSARLGVEARSSELPSAPMVNQMKSNGD